MKDPLKSIVLGIVKKDGRVLIIRRSEDEDGSHGEKLTWAFPGGKVEDNETIFEAAVRELHEETGYQVRALSLIEKSEHPTFPVLVHYVACDLINNEATSVNDAKIARVKWVTAIELSEMLTSSLNTAVKDYLDVKSS